MKIEIAYGLLLASSLSFGQEYWKFQTHSDSVEIGSQFRATVEIDTTIIKKLEDISVYLGPAKVGRVGNIFPISFVVVLKEPLKYDVRIVNKRDTTKFQRVVYGIKQKNPKTTISVVPLPEKMPEFKAKGFKSFDEYIIEKIKEENIEVRGILTLTFKILADGNTADIQVHSRTLNFLDKDKISNLIEGGGSWTPGQDKGKNVNVPINKVFNFQ
jgi:hypothetical protein